MSRSSVFLIALLSAVIGALLSGLLVTNVVGRSVLTHVDERFEELSSSAQEERSGPPEIGRDNPSQPVSVSLSGSFDQTEEVVTSVYNDISPSVVHVSTVQYYRNFFFEIVPQEGTGSGFIISEDGYILTNNHVVAGAQQIAVRLSNGEEYNAELVGTDQMTDLAVLHIRGIEIPEEWVTPLGDSAELEVGQRAIAIGNPFGLDSTVTVGVISALDRPVITAETQFENMIQTDASINPGNSGGPLIDSTGRVIGINTVIYSQSGGSHGIGFAIPVNLARTVASDLIEFGRVRRPSPGFTGLTIYPNLAATLNLPVQYGVLVQDVSNGSSAEEAGLRGGTNLRTFQSRFRQYRFYDDGDIIVAINGEKVTEVTSLTEQIRRMELGSTVTLTVYRGTEQLDVDVVLEE